MNYFNTTQQEGEQLKNCIEKANSQNELVLFWFLSNPSEDFMAEDIYTIISESTPKRIKESSVRRTITVLTDRGLLSKQPKELQKMGSDGHPCNVWTLSAEAFAACLFDYSIDFNSPFLDYSTICKKLLTK